MLPDQFVWCQITGFYYTSPDLYIQASCVIEYTNHDNGFRSFGYQYQYTLLPSLRLRLVSCPSPDDLFSLVIHPHWNCRQIWDELLPPPVPPPIHPSLSTASTSSNSSANSMRFSTTTTANSRAPTSTPPPIPPRRRTLWGIATALSEGAVGAMRKGRSSFQVLT